MDLRKCPKETNLIKNINDERNRLGYKAQIFLLKLINNKVITEAELHKFLRPEDILREYQTLVRKGFNIKRRELSPFFYRRKGRTGRAVPPKIVIYYI